MKYIIMCGGSAYQYSTTPKPLRVVCGEPLVVRTIRLLKDQGVNNIFISGSPEHFKGLGVPVLVHKNAPMHDPDWCWLNAFYPVREPVCYLCGDVFYSPEAIKTIVTYWTNDIMFFASAYPLSRLYVKRWREPLGFKVGDPDRFFKCVEKTKLLDKEHRFNREPVSWELWQVIKNTPLNTILQNYIAINDYSVDIDSDEEARELEKRVRWKP